MAAGGCRGCASGMNACACSGGTCCGATVMTGMAGRCPAVVVGPSACIAACPGGAAGSVRLVASCTAAAAAPAAAAAAIAADGEWVYAKGTAWADRGVLGVPAGRSWLSEEAAASGPAALGLGRVRMGAGNACCCWCWGRCCGCTGCRAEVCGCSDGVVAKAARARTRCPAALSASSSASASAAALLTPPSAAAAGCLPAVVASSCSTDSCTLGSLHVVLGASVLGAATDGSKPLLPALCSSDRQRAAASVSSCCAAAAAAACAAAAAAARICGGVYFCLLQSPLLLGVLAGLGPAGAPPMLLTASLLTVRAGGRCCDDAGLLRGCCIAKLPA